MRETSTAAPGTGSFGAPPAFFSFSMKSDFWMDELDGTSAIAMLPPTMTLRTHNPMDMQMSMPGPDGGLAPRVWLGSVA